MKPANSSCTGSLKNTVVSSLISESAAVLLTLVEEVLNRESHRSDFALFDLEFSEGRNSLCCTVGRDI